MEKILGKLLMLFHYLQLVIKTYELNTGKSKLVNCRFAFVTKIRTTRIKSLIFYVTMSSICFGSKSISHGSAKHFVYYKVNAKKLKRQYDTVHKIKNNIR